MRRMRAIDWTPVRRWLLTGANGLKVILALHFALGVMYTVTFPMWEGHDEWGHFDYVRFVVTHLRAPTLDEKVNIRFNERSQPPLYYFVAGPLTAWAAVPPQWFPALNTLVGLSGFNFAVHPDSEAFPYSGTPLAFHAARLVSLFLSLFGVLATYAITRLWFPGEKHLALLAAALYAAWPKYVTISSTVTNDILAAVSGALFMWAWSLWVLRRPTWKSGLALLATLVMMLLTKPTVYGLVALGGLGLLFTVSQFLPLPPRWRIGLALTLVATVCLGTLLALAGLSGLQSNTLFGARVMDRIGYIVRNFTSLGWEALPQGVPGGLRSFWATYGWANIPAPSWSYLLIGLIAVVSVIGLAKRLRQSSRSRRVAGLFGLSVGACLVPAVVETLVLKSSARLEGRFYLSALPPVAILLALGWHEFWPRRVAAKAGLTLGLGLFAFSASIPFSVFIPVFARPALLPPQAKTEIQHLLDLRYGPGIRLVGYDVSPAKVRPGEAVHVTLYWQSLEPVEDNYIVAIKLLTSEPQASVLAAAHGYPGGGNFATSLWKPGDFFKETYDLKTPEKLTQSLRGQFLVELLDAQWSPAFTPRDPHGNVAPNWFGEFKVIGPAPAFSPAITTTYRLNDQLALKGYTLSAPSSAGIKVDLLWEGLQLTAADYTIALALLDAGQHIVAQADAQPREGTYPTHLWDPGEQIVDTHVLPLPANLSCGEYVLYLGVYDLVTSYRLPVFDSSGVENPDRSIKIPVKLEVQCRPTS